VGVSDTGIGMTSQERSRIFRDFSRVRNAQTKKIPGSGLGLAIVRRIVEGYGGTVSVDSQPDRGSTFMVELPRCTMAHPQETKVAE
jgi:signal transduction histidine kinase